MTLLPPYVALAVFCKDARQDPDGTLTINSIVDRITVAESMTRLPQVASVVAVVALRCGAPWGTHQLGLDVRPPTGAARRLAMLPVDTSLERDSVARILRMDFEIQEFGDYWFDVRWDADIVSRMRLVVRPAAGTVVVN